MLHRVGSLYVNVLSQNPIGIFKEDENFWNEV
jgi:hypothetical protein